MLFRSVRDAINDIIGKNVVKRVSTDLFEDDSKLSISVATVSPLSSLIHFGINITSTNTPVKTKGLKDYDIEPYEFANLVIDRYTKEIEKIQTSRCKVKWVQ